MRNSWVVGAAMMALVGTVAAVPSEAQACGGCFAPTETQQVVTDHRMVMSIGPTESILWDQIRYTGRPEDFSWVLPVSGDVRVELASGEFFDTLDTLTSVTVRGPVVRTTCANSGRFAPSAASGNAADASSGQSPVTVIREEVVGPYQTVVLRSENGDALTEWLRTNNYTVPAAIQPVIQWYVDRHLDFVALRLRPGEGVGAMQPVRIRYASANMILPLRMVAAGISDKVGITLWVFGRGRHEAANFANGTINAGDLVWNWDTNRSNYPDVFQATLRALGGRAWITEAASNAGQYQYQFAYGRDATTTEDWNLATENNNSEVWVTRMRTDLAAQFLDTDLTLQASTNSAWVSNQLQATRTVGTSPEPRCPTGTTLNVGGGAGLQCSTTPGRGASRGSRYVLIGLLAGGVTFTVARRRGRTRND